MRPGPEMLRTNDLRRQICVDFYQQWYGASWHQPGPPSTRRFFHQSNQLQSEDHKTLFQASHWNIAWSKVEWTSRLTVLFTKLHCILHSWVWSSCVFKAHLGLRNMIGNAVTSFRKSSWPYLRNTAHNNIMHQPKSGTVLVRGWVVCSVDVYVYLLYV